MFNNLNIPSNVEKEADVVGGLVILESDLYLAKIVQAYATESKAGAKGLVVKFEVKGSNGTTYPFTNTFWVTNRKGEVTYQDKDGKAHFLMGFNQANTLCLGTVGKPITEVPSETRIYRIYDYTEKAEVPTEVQAFVSLVDKEVGLGILKVRENKVKLSGSEYVPTSDETFRNNVDKVFIFKDHKMFTQNEFDLQKSTADYAEKWLQKWQGTVQDKYKQLSDSSSTSSPESSLDIG